jgi:hypothetical protein
MESTNLFLVVYLGVQNIEDDEVHDYMCKVKHIVSSEFECKVLVITVDLPSSRIECINPKYITDENLINEHTALMKKLDEKLQDELNNHSNDK